MPRSMPTSWITVNWPSCFCKRREMNSYAAHSVNCWQRSWGGVALWFVLSSLAISARRSIQANLCTEVSKLKMSFLCKRSIENDKISHLQRIGCDTTKKTFYPYMDHRLKQSLLDFRFECSLAQRRVCWSMVVQFTFFCQSFLLWANSPTLSVTFSLLHHLCLPSLFSPSFCISLSLTGKLIKLIKLKTHHFDTVSIYLFFIFLHLCTPCAPLSLSFFRRLPLQSQQLWSKLISRWFCEMLIDWTV